jgi:hypothetical protein
MKIIVAGLMLIYCAGGLNAQSDNLKKQPGDSLKVKDSLSIQGVTDSAVVKMEPVLKIEKINSDLSGFDKIRLETGDSIIASIIAETPTEVAFKYPLNTMINKMLFTKIKEIDYKDGRVRAIRNNAPVTGVGAEPDNVWRIVVITYDEKDVAGMKEIGPISSKAEGKTYRTSIEMLEKNADLNMKKAAVRMNATKVLIKKKDILQEYGEIPEVKLEGIAYGVQ